MKCHKCKEEVKGTIHLADLYKIGYYVVDAILDQSPIVECIKCYNG